MTQNILVISEKENNFSLKINEGNATFCFFDALQGKINLKGNKQLEEKYESVVILPPTLPNLNSFDEQFIDVIRQKMIWYIRASQFFLKKVSPTKVVYVLDSADRRNKLDFLFNNAIISFAEGLLLETNFLGWNYAVFLTSINNLPQDPTIFTKKKIFTKFINGIKRKKIKTEIINKKRKIPANKISNSLRSKNNTNKTCIITGASGGIGYSIGSFLKEQDYNVHSFSRKEKQDPIITFHKCDVTSTEEIKNNLELVYSETKSINIIVNNSGYGIAGPIEEVKIDDFVKMLEVNFFAQIRLINSAISYLKESKGIIYNIGSMGGVFSLPFQVLYSVTKNMIDCYTELMAPELNKNNILICNIMPGDTNTNFWTSRIKEQLSEDNKYKTFATTSIANAEHEETHGHTPDMIGRLVAKLTKKKKLPLKATVGKYRVMLALYKLLSFKQIIKILKSVFKNG